MSRYSVVDGPEIEDNQVVLRVVIEGAHEHGGPLFVCRLTGFDSMTVEAFPAGQTPSMEGEYRAEATRAAMAYVDENVSLFEELFEELARRANA